MIGKKLTLGNSASCSSLSSCSSSRTRSSFGGLAFRKLDWDLTVIVPFDYFYAVCSWLLFWFDWFEDKWPRSQKLTEGFAIERVGELEFWFVLSTDCEFERVVWGINDWHHIFVTRPILSFRNSFAGHLALFETSFSCDPGQSLLANSTVKPRRIVIVWIVAILLISGWQWHDFSLLSECRNSTSILWKCLWWHCELSIRN